MRICDNKLDIEFGQLYLQEKHRKRSEKVYLKVEEEALTIHRVTEKGTSF